MDRKLNCTDNGITASEAVKNAFEESIWLATEACINTRHCHVDNLN